MSKGDMPPAWSGLPSPTVTEQRILRDAVDGLCDDLMAGGPVISGRAAIESWLAADCGKCHGNGVTADAGAGQRVPLVELQAIIDQRLIVPCDLEGSLLLRRLRDASMPPPGESPWPSADEVSRLADFILRPCR